MMFELSVQSHFSAAHQVKGYSGDCASIHGHTYRVKAVMAADKLDDIGMAVDFRQIKDILEKILAGLDHKNLNDIRYFKENNATAEYIAKYIFIEMKEQIKTVKSVTVWEGYNNSVTYYET
jgi:6-pyruvoyltetrahydropterin/6-carboxytetrahydropterin synthase